MIYGGTWPENAELPVDLFISDPVIVGNTATRCFSKFIKDVTRRLKIEKASPAEFSRKITDDLRIQPRITRGRYCLFDMNDAPFDVTCDPLLFFLQAARKDNIGVMCCL